MRNRPSVGIGLMVGGGLMLVISDATTKLLTENLSVAQVLLSKSLLTVLLLMVSAPAIGSRRMFRVMRWRGQFARVLLSVASTFLFITALKVLPLSTAVMLSFVGPLLVTALAPWFLGEKVDRRRWAAVIAGFGGVAVMVSPASGHFSYLLLLPLGAALCGALRDILTRSIAITESTESMVFYSFVGAAVAGLIASWGDLAVSVRDWSLIALASISHVAALYMAIEALRNTESVTVVPFKYCSLVWVTIIDGVVWAHVPRWNVLAGAIVIVVALLFIMRDARAVRHVVQPIPDLTAR